MSNFFTTKQQAEDYLTLEARALPMPDGSRRVVVGFPLMWKNVEFLSTVPPYTEAKLMELALHSQCETGRPLDQSFRNVVAYVMQQVAKRPL